VVVYLAGFGLGAGGAGAFGTLTFSGALVGRHGLLEVFRGGGRRVGLVGLLLIGHSVGWLMGSCLWFGSGWVELRLDQGGTEREGTQEVRGGDWVDIVGGDGPRLRQHSALVVGTKDLMRICGEQRHSLGGRTTVSLFSWQRTKALCRKKGVMGSVLSCTVIEA
jgi:hypothetical protein